MPSGRARLIDVCAPIGRLAECIAQAKLELHACPLPVTICGHIGDGNLHVLFAVNPDAPAEWSGVRAINDRMVGPAPAMDGTCTGKHGIGLGKRGRLRDELGASLDVTREIKRAFDPQSLFNLGKIFAAE